LRASLRSRQRVQATADRDDAHTGRFTEIQNLGKTPLGDRRVAVVEGGSFEGPKLKGTVLRGGSDWILARPDGALQLDVRLTLKPMTAR